MSDVYQKKIINCLLDKYEKSRLFSGDNKVNVRIKEKTVKIFPEYGEHSAFEEFREINTAIEFLGDKGLVSAPKGKNGMFPETELNIENLDESYRFTGRRNKRAVLTECGKMIEDWLTKISIIPVNDDNCKIIDVLIAFGKAQLIRIDESKLPQSFESIAEYEDILKLFLYLPELSNEILIRKLSVKLYGDSKKLEALEGKAETLLYEYGELTAEKDLVFEELGIIKTPSYVCVKGKMILYFGNEYLISEYCGSTENQLQMVDVSLIPGGIALSSESLKYIVKVVVVAQRLVTIENLTTYHEFDSGDSAVMYLGGFHNTVKRNFLRRVNIDNPNVEYYHFGDIDAGGFYILQHLNRETGLKFKSLNMDVATMEKYKAFTKKLTESDQKRLKKMLGGEFDDVIRYMLENNCKLEQEAIDNKIGF